MEHLRGNVVDIFKFFQKDTSKEHKDKELASEFVQQYMHYLVATHFKGNTHPDSEHHLKKLSDIAQKIAKQGNIRKIQELSGDMIMPVWRDIGTVLELIHEHFHEDFDIIAIAQHIDNSL